MATASTTTLVDALRQFRLLDSKQLDELSSLHASFPEPKALAGELIRRGWLTAYQAEQILQGSGRELLLGSYVLLEKLGEGGMGQVFKARNWKLGREVALKLIRKQRLDNPDAVRRFEREVRSAAALSHPNIVHAYDADQVGGTHLLVMEYIEGTDLAKLVKKHGPLSVERACEYVRQVALGLQHAHERGLVHRDVKPHNLLLTADGKTVKILDMGLARLNHSEVEEEVSSTMTQEGVVMGTADYMAPEQALDSHTVDIRADLYSLGCTLYYLLTGRAPFGGGTMMQKLMKHRLEEPRPVEQLCPALPPAVAGVERKLMAKKVEDRYQTPAEVATALGAVLSQVSDTTQMAVGDRRTLVEARPPVVGTSGKALDSPFASLASSDTAEAADLPQRLRRRAAGRRRLLLSVASGVLMVAGVVFLLSLLFKEPGGNKPSRKEDGLSTDNDPATKEPPESGEEAWLKRVAALPAGKQAAAVAARLKELNPGFDGQITHKVEGGAVTDLRFQADSVTDISPVRALKGLRELRCGSDAGKGKLSDLSPLKDLKLTVLYCHGTLVSDLSPLKGMPLEHLECHGTRVSDLTPLKGMPLTNLQCHSSRVSDLSPLKGMPLTSLECNTTPVADLSPLKGMRLTSLGCACTPVSDLAPLQGMPLTTLRCYVTQVSDLSPLKGMPLAELNCFGTPVSDLSALKGMPLRGLWCNKSKVSDLSPLKGMPLVELSCHSTKVSDLSPLKGMSLTHLACYETAVADLSPLKGMKLTVLYFGSSRVADLSPLRGMPLTSLDCSGTKVSDLSLLKELPLKELWCDFKAGRDTEVLRSIKTLEKINDKPAGQFWKEVDEKKP